MQRGFDIQNLRHEANYRWLKPTEVFYILRNHERVGVSQVVSDKPPSGSLILYNKRVLRYFRKDGYEWQKKKDGRTVNEAHEHLKVGNLDAINCYYAQGEQNSYFRRRCYWLLDPAYEHIVLVHYREISEGRYTSGPSTSSDVYSSFNSSSCFTDAVVEPFQSSQSSDSPLSIEEVSSKSKGANMFGYENIDEGFLNLAETSRTEFESALHKLEAQLSLDDDTVPTDDNTPKLFQTTEPDFQMGNGLSVVNNVEVVSMPIIIGTTSPGDIQPTASTSHAFEVSVPSLNNSSLLSATNKRQESFSTQQRGYGEINVEDKYNGCQDPGSTFELLLAEARKFISEFDEFIVPSMSTVDERTEGGYNGGNVITCEPENVNKETCSDWSIASTLAANVNSYPSDFSELILNHDQGGTLLVEDIRLTIADKQLFSIHEISPEHAFSSVSTKVIIIGDFLCDSSDYSWKAMFGDTEVPLEIIRNGVLRCWTPQHLLGKVSLSVTSGNRVACSELRDFEFISKPERNAAYEQSEMGKTKVTEDLKLLTRLAKILFCDLDSIVLAKVGADDPKDASLLESVGENNSGKLEAHTELHENPLLAACWILQEILKDKLRNWLSDKCQGNPNAENNICSLSKQEQGIIHMISGLGYDWALKPLLDSGLGINFRDANGWTALHWAARFGREKAVSALIATGASPGAVTDPTSQDPVGRTPASLASVGGHKGLAGYLSEVALTNHLLSLTIGESEISQACAAVEAEKILESIYAKNILPRDGTTEDQLSLQDSLAAVKNAARAAARIQAAFRALSFKKRQQKTSYLSDEYELTPEEIYSLSVAPRYHPYQKGAHGTNDQKLHGAALCIQKKYRGWKGRKNFLTLRKNIVKIQAHVRGYQVRKKYRLLWCVNVLEKVILRWRRKGVGLRGFRTGFEDMSETEEEEDILKIFRKQKVDAALDEAVNRVLSMVESQEARLQYRRLLDCYRHAKAEQIKAATDQSILFENIDEEMQQYLNREEPWGNFL